MFKSISFITWKKILDYHIFPSFLSLFKIFLSTRGNAAGLFFNFRFVIFATLVKFCVFFFAETFLFTLLVSNDFFVDLFIMHFMYFMYSMYFMHYVTYFSGNSLSCFVPFVYICNYSTFDVIQIASYEITLVHLSVCRSVCPSVHLTLNFLKIG